MDFDFFPKLWFIFVNTLNHPNLSVSCYTPILSPCVFPKGIFFFEKTLNHLGQSDPCYNPNLSPWENNIMKIFEIFIILFFIFGKNSESPSTFRLLLQFRLVSLSLWDFHNFIFPLWKNTESPRSFRLLIQSRYVYLCI